ncbi:hypothetical protein ACX9R5_12935 [Rathayibacter sp. CAU 1779]
MPEASSPGCTRPSSYAAGILSGLAADALLFAASLWVAIVTARAPRDAWRGAFDGDRHTERVAVG